MTTNLLLLAGGIGVLYFGAEWLVRGAARLAASLGVHSIVIGLTVVSFGTSAPELVVSLVAALDGNSDIAMGNVLGSNLANIGLILGLSALVRPLKVATRVVHREVPVMLVVTLLLYPLVMDLSIARGDGLLLVAILVLYLYFMFRSGAKEPEMVQELEEMVGASDTPAGPSMKDVFLVIVGVCALVLGGRAIVHSAEAIASAMGISQMVIGLTVIAVGTSLPELATSAVAAVRGEADIAVGNVIGSNVFNVAAILGITATITPISVNETVITRGLPAVLVLSFLAWPITRGGWQIRRWEGAFLILVYVGLTYWLVAGASA